MIKELAYDLPPELIAQFPLPERDAARLLVVHADGRLRDAQVRELPALLPLSLWVFNNTSVIAARLRTTRRGGGAAEFVLVQKVSDGGTQSEWLAMAKPAKRVRAGDCFQWNEGLALRVLGRNEREGFLRVQLSVEEGSVDSALQLVGELPLPPYIERAGTALDRQRYQTVFASKSGAVAAPTAGLHFSGRLLERLRAAGHDTTELTLHVGPGTFRPIQVQTLSEHRMHEERYEIPESCAAAIARARKQGRAVVAVGTTVTRALESAATEEGLVSAGKNETDIFITPGYRFRVVDHLVTNFHLPQSTLLALVMAFAGVETIQHAYSHAIAQRYRFYSYGDAMLLERSR